MAQEMERIRENVEGQSTQAMDSGAPVWKDGRSVAPKRPQDRGKGRD